MVVKSGKSIIKGETYFILHGKKKYINYHRTHTILINHIIQCYHIDIISENHVNHNLFYNIIKLSPPLVVNILNI